MTGHGAHPYNKAIMAKIKHLSVYLSIFWALSCSPAFAQFGGAPQPTVRVEFDPAGQAVVAYIQVPDDHHITDLKYGFFGIKLAEHPLFTLGETRYPAGEPFGEERVYKGTVVLQAPLLTRSDWQAPQTLSLTVSWQMCQESPAEMCFAPDERQLELTISEPFAAKTVASADPAAQAGPSGGFVDRMIGRFQQQLASHSVWAFLSVFLLGFLTSLTPCVYPVIPVIMGFVGSRSQGSKAKAFSLSLFFVFGLAFVYSLLGVVAAQTGSVIGASFQSPVFVVVIALIFVTMGLSMAGLFDIPVPSAIAAKAQSGARRNQWLGALVVGAVSGFIAAPCAGPVVIALVTFISQTGDLPLGFGLMLFFALGMGVIFLLVGTFSGMVGALPQGGGWMEKVKLFFALLLIGAGIYFVGVVTPDWVSTLLWGVFWIGFALLAGALETMPEEIPKRFGRLLVVLILLLGVFLFFDGLRQWRHGDQGDSAPAGGETSSLSWLPDSDQALAAAKDRGQPLLIDAYADWCTACKELDHKTFRDSAVQARLRQMTLLKLDLTENSEASRALRKRFAILAMPTVIVVDSEQKELGRFSGFLGPQDFLGFLDRTLR